MRSPQHSFVNGTWDRMKRKSHEPYVFQSMGRRGRRPIAREAIMLAIKNDTKGELSK